MFISQLIEQYRNVEESCTTCRKRDKDTDVCNGFTRDRVQNYVCGVPVYARNPKFENDFSGSKVTVAAHPLRTEIKDEVKSACPNYKPTIPVVVGRAAYSVLAPVLAHG